VAIKTFNDLHRNFRHMFEPVFAGFIEFVGQVRRAPQGGQGQQPAGSTLGHGSRHAAWPPAPGQQAQAQAAAEERRRRLRAVRAGGGAWR